MEKQNTRQLPNDTAMAWYMVDRYSTVEKKKFGETRYCEILLKFVPRNFVEISLKCTCKVTVESWTKFHRNFEETKHKIIQNSFALLLQCVSKTRYCK